MIVNGYVFDGERSIDLEPGAATLLDTSRYGNDGTITGATWTQLPSGLWYLLYDGTDDYTDLTNVLTDLRGAISLWANPGAAIDGEGVIISQSQGAAANEYLYLIFNTNKYRLDTWSAGARDTITWGTPVINTWQHIVLSTDGATWVAYVDGVLEALTVAAGANNGEWFGDIASPDYLRFGGLRVSNLNASDLSGGVSLPRIYNYPLSAGQARNIFETERYLLGV